MKEEKYRTSEAKVKTLEKKLVKMPSQRSSTSSQRNSDVNRKPLQQPSETTSSDEVFPNSDQQRNKNGNSNLSSNYESFQETVDIEVRYFIN